MRGLAFAIQVAYVGFAFGWRTWLQWRRTGDTGFRLSAESPFKDRAASLLVTTGAGLGLVGAAIGSGVDELGPVGLALMVLGLAVTLKSQLDLGRSWRVGVDHDERTELVTSGAFALSRNPIFAGMAAVAIGTAAAVTNVATVLGAVLLVGGVEVQVRLVEEPYLLRVHGEEYRDYAARTGRFVPGVGRLPTAV